MSVRVGDLQFHAWQSLELLGGWTDTFIFRMAPTDGLPPADYAGVVRALAAPLRRLRPNASLWVQIGSHPSPGENPAGVGQQPKGPGAGVRGKPTGPATDTARWFREEVRYALRGLTLPVAVTGDHAQPQIWDFSFFPRVDPRPYPPPPAAEPYLKEGEFRPAELACLRVLARSECAYTAEVASLANLSKTGARGALRRLADRRLIVLDERGKFPLWRLRRPGLSRALRSWGLPPGKRFPGRRERGRDACAERVATLPGTRDTSGPSKRVTFAAPERVSFWSREKRDSEAGSRRLSTGRHRRTARLWPTWLRQAWPQAQVWAGWSEVACGRTRPDALCWGHVNGSETLFWLEVESGNHARQRLQRKTKWRVNRAWQYSRRSAARLVFVVLGPPWVGAAIWPGIQGLSKDLAVVIADWKQFGTLPMLQWGRVCRSIGAPPRRPA